MCVCDSGCDPELFENTLRLRELRLDLEELLAEKKKSAEALKKMCDTVVKKVLVVTLGHTISVIWCFSPVCVPDSLFFGGGGICRRKW